MFTGPLRYDTFSPRIFELVRSETRVLDVGCGTGRLAEALRTAKRCYVVGLELNPVVAEEARFRCDHLMVGDVENLEQLSFSGGFFDVIILGDVLEHCRFPDKVLIGLRPLLHARGELLISVPNVAFITVRLNLLLGRFDYSAQGGILDASHLRFFTLKSIRRLVEACGYNVVAVHSQNVVRRPLSFLRPLGRLWKPVFSIQLILMATKTDDS